MLKILKAEIEYFKIPLIAMVIPLIAFAVFAAADIQFFQSGRVLKKFFWPLTIGMGTYALVFIIWTFRKKELRDRSQSVLPISLDKITFTRWLFGIAPLILIWTYLELLRNFIVEDQVVFGINLILGFMYIFIVSFDLILNLDAIIFNYTFIISYLVAIIISALSVIISFLIFKTSVLPILIIVGSEFYFIIWVILLSILDAYVFKKRKSFLG